MKRWFLPETPDVLALLVQQAEVTRRGLEAFVAWSEGDAARAEEVRSTEHEADDVRRLVQRALREAFSTPLDAEDLYALSERLDAVLNGAKNAVREAEVMGMAPDPPLARMAREVADGVGHLREAFAHLASADDDATLEADAAIRCERNLERAYRAAMSDLLAADDLREVLGRRELYRRYSRLGEQVVRVAERVWYAVVKAG